MKKLFILLFTIITLGSAGQQLEVMSFNIRYNNINDGEDQWNNRKEAVADLIEYYNPAVLGVQEALYGQMQFLDSALKQYSYIGVGRDDGQKAGEFSAILYDTTKVGMIDSGTFWLSDTPDEVSKGWDAALPRICTYGLFREKSSEKVFWTFNTHFDHVGEIARVRSAALIVNRIGKMNIAEAPVLLIGDLNSAPDSGPITLLDNNLIDSRNSCEVTYGPEGTFFGFELDAEALNRIDYVFGKNLTFDSYRVIDDRLSNNRHISDHLPVFVKFTFN